MGKHHGLDTLASPQRQAGVEVGVVAVERALDAVDAQEDEEQEAENRDRERLGMGAGEGETVGAAASGRRFFEKVKVSKMSPSTVNLASVQIEKWTGGGKSTLIGMRYQRYIYGL